MRNSILACLFLLGGALLLCPLPVHAQVGNTQRGRIAQLFILGSGDEPLYLGGSADPNNPATIQAHGNHFVPAAVAENASLIGFIGDAIAASVGNVPIATTSGGVTFRFEGGIPVKTSLSAGPIFAERAQTLGRGRTSIGVGRSSFQFTSLRGVPMDNLSLIFTHENVNFAGCDSVNGGPCAKMGIPTLENEIMAFRLNLDMNITVTTIYATYGVADRLDIGVIVPLVSTHLHGESTAQIIPFGPPPAVHFFGGTPTDPVLSASRTVEGSSFGLGDVAVRMKVGVREAQNSGLALLGEARFGTGNPDDLLGSGAFSARGMAVMSGRINAFSPHLDIGYLYHARSAQRTWNDAVLITGGFDHLISERVTLAADVVSELQVGRSRLHLPGPVTFDVPYHRTIEPTTIPDRRDDLISGSFGGKFTIPKGFTVIANALVPLNNGGMRAEILYTTGIELDF